MDNTKLTFTFAKAKDTVHAAIMLGRDYNWNIQSIRGRVLVVWRENPSSYTYDNAITTVRDVYKTYPITSVDFGYYKHKEPKPIKNAA